MRTALVAFALVLAACSSTNKDKSQTAVSASWPQQMRAMATDLQALLPYVYSRREFHDSENRKKVSSIIDRFSRSVDTVPKHVGEAMLGQDPIVRFSLNRLSANTEHAKRAFSEGHLEFARGLLKENVGLCFQCHTTTQFGPQNNFTTEALPSGFRMSANERADYYVATRQFDRAVGVLEGEIKSPSAVMDNPHEAVAALRKYLALEVRVKKDPARAASAVERFLDNSELPYFIAVDAEAWLKSLREMTPRADRVTLSRAKELIRRGSQKQSSGGYQSGYVDFLRASTLLHEILRNNGKNETKAQIFQLLGESYDTLSEMGTWDLPEVYFEACVRTSPGTDIAKRCYRDFERSIIVGFSGSAGVFIPKEERARMAELKKLAGY